MGVKEASKDWDAFGKLDAMWAILTDPAKRGKQWKAEEFFETGVAEIRDLMAYVESLAVSVPRHKALDFGCGVGRLTQALAAHFENVDGVDVAPSMIELANQYNRWPGRCTYHVNTTSSLSFFADDTFNLIYSSLVLQHIEPRYSKSYIQEFVRVLAPGGVIVFQLPSVPSRPVDLLKHRVKQAIKASALAVSRRTHYFTRPLMLMYGMRRDEVERVLRDSGARILDVKTNHSAGGGMSTFRYCVTKP